MVKRTPTKTDRGRAYPIRLAAGLVGAAALGFHLRFACTHILDQDVPEGPLREFVPLDQSLPSEVTARETQLPKSNKISSNTRMQLQTRAPQKEPLLSIVLLTGGRLHKASETLSRVVDYLNNCEPQLPCDVIWTDNGVSSANRSAASAEFEKLHHFE